MHCADHHRMCHGRLVHLQSLCFGEAQLDVKRVLDEAGTLSTLSGERDEDTDLVRIEAGIHETVDSF